MSEVFATLTEGETSDIYSFLSLFPSDGLPPSLETLRIRLGAQLKSSELAVSLAHRTTSMVGGWAKININLEHLLPYLTG
jgi:hypothetical protein